MKLPLAHLVETKRTLTDELPPGTTKLRPGQPREEAGGERRSLPLRRRVHPGGLPLHLRPRQARHDQHAGRDLQEQARQSVRDTTTILFNTEQNQLQRHFL